MIPLNELTHLTFDCYGTLIDWEQGILNAVRPVLARYSIVVAPETVLQSYVRNEARLEAQSWRPYREILREVMTGIAGDFGLRIKAAEQNALIDSLSQWPPFPDTVAALQLLSTRFRLAVLSNIDDALFLETQKHLKVEFAEIITAEQVKSYKPAHAHFNEALRRLAVPANKVLHVAQSRYHDHVPARQLGFRTAWINRQSLLSDTGLAPTAEVKPDLVFSDLASLAAQILN